MEITRRSFVKAVSAGIVSANVLPLVVAAEASKGKIRISARHFGGNFEAAKRAGMQGVEVGVGGAEDTLRIAKPETIKKYKDMAAATGILVSSLSMDLMNGHPSGTDENAPKWIMQTVEAAAELKADGILLPFFGKAHLLKGKEFKKEAVDGLVKRLKEIGPKAEAAGVSIGIECTLSAQRFIEILDRIGSGGVSAYYDIGNSTNAGLDVPADLRALKGRMKMIHFKDGRNYLGEGKCKMEPVAAALKEIDYKGWVVLETSCPSKNAEADCKRNADFSRKLLGLT